MALRIVKLGGSLLDLPGVAERLRRWLAGQPPAATLLVVGGGRLADAIRQAQRVHAFDDAAAHRLCLEVMGVTAALACELWPEARLCRREAEIDRAASGGLQIVDVREFLIAAAEPPIAAEPPSRPLKNGTVSEQRLAYPERNRGSEVPVPIFQHAASAAEPLPESWQVTSDSIAAHLALVLGAEELVLLKSTLPESRLSQPGLVPALACVDALAAQGVVDDYFPQAVKAFLAGTILADSGRRESGDACVRLVNLRHAQFAEVSVLLAPAGNSASSGWR